MIPALERHIIWRKELHERDAANGFGFVELPGRLEKKYANANREFRWQFLFPSNCIRDGFRWHATAEAVQTQMRNAVRSAGLIKRVTPYTLLDNGNVMPHTVRYEIRAKKQAIRKMVNCSPRRFCAVRQKPMDLQMRLRNHKKYNDAKPCQRKIEGLRKRQMRSDIETWGKIESHAGICSLDLHEAKMPKSKSAEFPSLGRTWNHRLSRMDRRFREVFIPRWFASIKETLSRQNQNRWKLRAGECSVGVASRSTKQPERQSSIGVQRQKILSESMDERAWIAERFIAPKNFKWMDNREVSYAAGSTVLIYAHTQHRGVSPMDGRKQVPILSASRITFESSN
jgi:hypothetical protein